MPVELGPETEATSRDIESTVHGKRTWIARLSRDLTDAEWRAYSEGVADVAWDRQDEDLDLPQSVFVLSKVAPDVQIEAWWHAPYMVLVHGLYLPNKVFEIENAMSLRDARQVAESTWREQFRHLGIRATVAYSRKAKKRDMKHMREVQRSVDSDETDPAPGDR